jgi:hypothetical protein
MRRLLLIIPVLMLFYCCSPALDLLDSVQGDATVEDTPGLDGMGKDLTAGDTTSDLGDLPDVDLFTDLTSDMGDDTGVDLLPGCKPGDGCFLDDCTENNQCQSGWCVEHMGEGICTKTCVDECPPGWSCKMLGQGGTDPVYLCISSVSNLCKPCAGNADCKSPGGQEDVCVDYGPEGSFCGGVCLEDEDCPWGFSCAEAESVDGVELMQCVADAGTCPCAAKSVTLGLSTPCTTTSEWGICYGKRVCAEAGLSDCDALVAIEESCNGFDDDCDGDIDEPTELDGNLINLCEDGNPCTLDSCKGTDGCLYENLEDGECMDGDACTIGDHCDQGTCLGTPIDCVDDDPCTDDSCDGLGGCKYELNNADCDDADPCTVADECLEGTCSGFPIPCDCAVDDDCQPLEDDDLCNGYLVCDNDELPYQCKIQADSVVECPQPEGFDAPCLKATCNPLDGSCSMVPDNDGFACDDGAPCTLGDYCLDGICKPGVEANCNDGNPCTDDSCDPAQDGCVNVNNTEPCEDTSMCTVGDTCENGICSAGPVVNCDDGNPCTDDSCDPALGCVNLPVDVLCDDGNECTTDDHCVEGKCVFSETMLCNDQNLCTTDTCDPAVGCVYAANSVPCEDGSKCTAGDTCNGSSCVPGPELNCEDDNPCTNDSCNPDLGCVHLDADLDCDDGNLCTTDDHCVEGKCVFVDNLPCNDQNLCTTDTCVPSIGCVYALNDAPCTDNDLCTTGDHCNLGECITSGSLNCNDNNICTDDSCDTETGCQFIPNQAVCSDDSVCSDSDKCSNGWCVPGPLLDCDDKNPCTDDSCHPESGCINTPNILPCEDGDACTENDICSNEVCVAGDAVVCDDLNDCTEDVCNFFMGCVYAAIEGACEDGDACTENDICDNGLCVSGSAVTCDDSKVCTDDHCDNVDGCQFVANVEPCTDNDKCTENDMCSEGECVPGAALTCEDNNSCTKDACDSDSGCSYTPLDNGTDCGQDKICVDGACTSCGQLHGDQNFQYTGSQQTFVVPDCITSVTISTTGASGGTGQKGTGGKGGRATATLPVQAGETLYIYVGGQGASGNGAAGGWNGGGNGTSSNTSAYGGGGGGGGSDIRQGGTGLEHRVVVAGGGGGGGADGCTAGGLNGGNGGGLSGTNGQAGNGCGGCEGSGAGGTQDAGGAHGKWACSTCNSTDGSPGQGGNGDTATSCGSTTGGGGGGGGYYGGGGGGLGAGGGGSGFVGPTTSNALHETGVNSGPGAVVISW